MKTYVHKPTGQKLTEREYQAVRQQRAMKKRQRQTQRFMMISFVLTFILLVGIFMWPNRAEANGNLKDMPTVDVRIQPEQTVWDLVAELTPNHPTRDVVVAMNALNHGKDFDQVKAYSDVITFYIDPSVDASSIPGLVIID